MKKCVAYLRYSTPKQGALSFEYQTEEIVKYCNTNNLLLMKTFSDSACRGKNAKRPAFLEMIEEAKSNPEWDVILLYNLSRFSRNEEDANAYKKLLRSLDIAVISVTEKCTEEDPGGFMETCLDRLYANESRKKGVASYDSLRLISKQCKHCGGKPPLGYDVDKETGLLVVNESEAQLVKTIFNMYNMGFSYPKIAKYLNGIGEKTKAGNSFSAKSFRDILTQEKYVGTFLWGKHPQNSRNLEKALTVVENGCSAIISKELFAEVQERMSDSGSGNRCSKSQNHYMLNGLRILKCGCCGKYLTGKSYTSKGYKYVKYSCPDRKCVNKSVDAENLDNCIANILLKMFFLNQSRDTLNALISSSQDPTLLKVYENKLRGVKMKQGNLIELLAEVPSEAAKDKLKALSNQQAFLEGKIAEQQAVLPQIPADGDTEAMEKVCDAIRDELINSDDLDVKLFIKSAVKEILVEPNDITITLAQTTC